MVILPNVKYTAPRRPYHQTYAGAPPATVRHIKNILAKTNTVFTGILVIDN
jgi:hypothetical protein